jgi:SlyX protein
MRPGESLAPSAPAEVQYGMESVYPTDTQRVDQRLTDLEIKASFTEDLLDDLNQLVAQQQKQIDLMVRELASLRQQGPADDVAAPRSLRDELPPHY